MSAKSLAHQPYFAPDEGIGNRLAKIWREGKRTLASISQGRDAHAAYLRLVANGVAPDRAARLVLTEIYGRG